jgi:uncharacterized protein (DUF433 family)
LTVVAAIVTREMRKEWLMDTDNVVVFTEAKVRALAGVSQRQLRYWARDLALPAVDRQITEHRGVRLYDYDGVLTVMVLAELKSRGKSLQYLRQVARLIEKESLRFPELVFATSGSRVHFQRPTGEWQDAERNQTIDAEVVPLSKLREKVDRSLERDPRTVGKIERRRGAMGSKELMAGTRVPVATVRRYLDRGIPVAEVLEAFPMLEPEDVEAVQASA